MKKTLVAACSLLALCASVASAAPGIDLAWTDCGSAGTTSQTWTCDTNTGTPFTLFASFIPPAGINQFVGISSQMDFTSTTPVLPDWWQHGTGLCRGTAGMTISFDFTSGPIAFVDPWVGSAAFGSVYNAGFVTPNRARLIVQGAIPTEEALDPAAEYYAYKVNLQRSKTSGTGSCAGCLVPMCIVLNDCQLFQNPAAANDPDITNPGPTGNFATWQATSIPNCPQSTPTHNSSWGKLKSLYR